MIVTSVVQDNEIFHLDKVKFNCDFFNLDKTKENKSKNYLDNR